jgi:hypothetical protein
VGIELGFEKILPAYNNLDGGQRLILFQIGLFSTVEETHVYFQGMLEAGASSALFPCENLLSF